MRKILHIQKVLGIYGSERHLLSLLPRLDPSRFEITFLVLEDPRTPVDDYLDLFNGSGVRVDKMPIRSDADPRLLFRLRNYILDGGFDMVHTHLIHGELYGTLAARLAGTGKIISSKHGYGPYMEKRSIAFLQRSVSRFHEKIIIISQALGDYIVRVQQIDREKMTLIHYGIDPPAVPDPASVKEFKRQWDIDSTVMAAVGRLVPVKGHRTLLESLPKVLEGAGEFTLLFAGDGPLEGELRKLAGRLGVDRYVRFIGFLPDIHPLLGATDLLVHPSLGEGFGLAPLEAMGHGLPVVASRVLALAEVIEEDKSGLLVPPEEPGQLADAIITLLKNAQLRKKMGEAGRQRFLENFTLDKMVKKTEAVYEEILAETKC